MTKSSLSKEAKEFFDVVEEDEYKLRVDLLNRITQMRNTNKYYVLTSPMGVAGTSASDITLSVSTAASVVYPTNYVFQGSLVYEAVNVQGLIEKLVKEVKPNEQ